MIIVLLAENGKLLKRFCFRSLEEMEYNSIFDGFCCGSCFLQYLFPETYEQMKQ